MYALSNCKSHELLVHLNSNEKLLARFIFEPRSVSISPNLIKNNTHKYSPCKHILIYRKKNSKIRAKIEIPEGKVKVFCSLCMLYVMYVLMYVLT